MSDLLSDLIAACHDRPAASDGEKVSEGETLWLVGQPVPTDKGYIGLSMADGHAVILSEASICEVKKDDNLYFVRVPVGIAVLVRSEAVTTLRSMNGDCRCPEESAASPVTKIARENTGSGPVIIKCPLRCSVEYLCDLHLTKSGGLLHICLPYLFCRRECPTIPA